MKKQIRLTLDEKLQKAGMSRYRLALLTNTNLQTLDRCYKNQAVRYDSDILLRICLALDCPIGDIIKVE